MTEKTTPTFDAGGGMLTVQELAKFLRCSPQTVIYGHLVGGGPRATKIAPRLTRYRVADVQAWLAQLAATDGAITPDQVSATDGAINPDQSDQ